MIHIMSFIKIGIGIRIAFGTEVEAIAESTRHSHTGIVFLVIIGQFNSSFTAWSSYHYATALYQDDGSIWLDIWFFVHHILLQFDDYYYLSSHHRIIVYLSLMTLWAKKDLFIFFPETISTGQTPIGTAFTIFCQRNVARSCYHQATAQYLDDGSFWLYIIFLHHNCMLFDDYQ